MRSLLVSTAAIVVLLASVAAAQAQWRVLERGDRGEDVELVQQALDEVGFATESDGVFGRGTERSVRRYEERHDLAEDGRVSRGQARGLLRRAGMDPALVDRPTADDAPARRLDDSSDGGPVFPIDGDWEWGRGMGADGGHEGVDVMADCGLPLVAPEGGKVVLVKSHASAGNYVVVRAPSGEDHVFMHLASPSEVPKGTEVRPGDRLGEVGRTGNASACHLHFEIWTAPGWYEGGSARDPKPDLKRWSASS